MDKGKNNGKKNKKDEGKKETNGKQRRKDNSAHKVVKNMPRIKKKEKKGKKAKNTPKKNKYTKRKEKQNNGKKKTGGGGKKREASASEDEPNSEAQKEAAKKMRMDRENIDAELDWKSADRVRSQMATKVMTIIGRMDQLLEGDGAGSRIEGAGSESHHESNGRKSSKCTDPSHSTCYHRHSDWKKSGSGSRDGKEIGYIHGEELQDGNMGKAPGERGETAIDSGILDGMMHRRAADTNCNQGREKASVHGGQKITDKRKDRPRYQRNDERRRGSENVVPNIGRRDGHGKRNAERSGKEENGRCGTGATGQMDETRPEGEKRSKRRIDTEIRSPGFSR